MSSVISAENFLAFLAFSAEWMIIIGSVCYSVLVQPLEH